VAGRCRCLCDRGPTCKKARKSTKKVKARTGIVSFVENWPMEWGGKKKSWHRGAKRKKK